MASGPQGSFHSEKEQHLSQPDTELCVHCWSPVTLVKERGTHTRPGHMVFLGHM